MAHQKSPKNFLNRVLRVLAKALILSIVFISGIMALFVIWLVVLIMLGKSSDANLASSIEQAQVIIWMTLISLGAVLIAKQSIKLYKESKNTVLRWTARSVRIILPLAYLVVIGLTLTTVYLGYSAHYGTAKVKEVMALTRIEFRLAYGQADPVAVTPEQIDACDTLTVRTGRVNELDRIVIMSGCLGGCALANIDVADFILRGPSPEADT